MFTRALSVMIALASADARPPVTFEAGVAAIFRKRCVHCHGAREQSGGLRLDSYENIVRGGDRGPPIVPGDPEASLVFQKVLRRDEPAMPPRKSLPAGELATLRAWILAGAGR